jgi:Zn-dependent protease
MGRSATSQRWQRLVEGVPIGRILGVPVLLSPSWLLLAAALTLGYGRLFDRQGPGALSYALAGGVVVCLAVSVLLHELGHALLCRRFGIGVRAVTLEMFGGYTEMDRDAPNPRQEATISLAGPAVSLALGLAAAAVMAMLPEHTVARQLAFQLAATNLIIAAFNALPGLPLDGGRALLALVWARTGDQYRASRVAGLAGVAVAVACLVAAVATGTRGGTAWLGALALAVVGFGVANGAVRAIGLGRLGARLPLLDALALARPIYRVPAGTSLHEAHRRAAAAGIDGPALAVAGADGAVLAVVDSAADAAVPADRRGDTAVETVAREVDGRVLPSGLRGADVLRAVGADPTGDYLVASGEDVVGVLRGADITNLLTSRETAR